VGITEIPPVLSVFLYTNAIRECGLDECGLDECGLAAAGVIAENIHTGG
jgi:hypothetical protein